MTAAGMALCLVLAAPPAAIADAEPNAPAEVAAVTAPSEDLTLSFTTPGRIAALPAEEGRPVRAGDLLARLDDSLERLRVDLLKARAEDDTDVQVAELQLARKEAVFAEVRKAFTDDAAPQRELDEAKLEAALARLALASARFDLAEARIRHAEAALLLKRMQLTAPVGGLIERVHRRAGEAVDALVPVIRLVRTDPLWIDVPAPVRLARSLRPGHPVTVRFADGSAGKAKIIRVAAVADAASETLEVRVEFPNPAGRPAGEQVTVRIPRAGNRPAATQRTPPAAQQEHR